MKKKIFVILVAASLCVASFAGCKGGETSAVSRKDAVVTESSEQSVNEEKEDKETIDKKDTTSKVKVAEKATKVIKATPAAKDDKKETSVEKSREDNKKTENTKSTSKASGTDSQKTTSVNKNTSASGSSGNTGSSKPSSGNNAPATSSGGSGSTSNKPGHTHNWVAQTKVVHHDAVTENVWVMDSAAWDEPVYEEQPIYELQATGVRCKRCGAVFSTVSEWNNHSEAMSEQDDWSHGAFETILENVQVGTQTVQVDTIHHDTTGHVETKVISAAWDETVTTSYKCSCGATK